MRKYLFSSESVGEGHPDKVADQISDALLDAILEQDPNVIAGIETFVNTGYILVGGEVTGEFHIDPDSIARETVKNIGFDSSDKGFDAKTCGFLFSLDKQSQDLTSGIFPNSTAQKHGAGDQGMMFGYAVNETQTLMPMTIHLAHRLAEDLAQKRKGGELGFLWPDCKTQITMDYIDGKPNKVRRVVVSSQHSPEVELDTLREAIIESSVKKVIGADLLAEDVEYFINSTGRFVTGGPQGDVGMTGRKIIVDSYGGHGSHGGGAFSGKDPSKTDRSGAYLSRHIAKNLVAAGALERCLVQVAYAIAVDKPMSVYIEDYGTGAVPIEKIEECVAKLWPFRPLEVIQKLDLRKPRYKKTAAYGHFGREGEAFTWEQTDMVDQVRSELAL